MFLRRKSGYFGGDVAGCVLSGPGAEWPPITDPDMTLPPCDSFITQRRKPRASSGWRATEDTRGRRRARVAGWKRVEAGGGR